MMRAVSIANVIVYACVGATMAFAASFGRAQQAQPAGMKDQTPVFTLKVYTDLVQVPTLVLDHDKQPLRPIDPKRFQISLDDGKKFAPTHVRLEGEDPLSLAIVFDIGTKQRSELAPVFADAVATTMAKALHPQDRISVYLLSCSLLRTTDQAIPDAAMLEPAIEAGLQSPKIGKNSAGVPCGTKVYLWGAMAWVINGMMETPGRRAILLISGGHDDGSAISWGKLHDYAGIEGVALFGFRDEQDAWNGWTRDRADEFASLCESTGGIVMDGGKRDLQKRLRQWISLLRGRYIVEFPRPQTLAKGTHDIAVSIRKDWLAFTTLAGVSVSLPDPKITSDPNYIPSQEGADIPVGKRRPLPQH